MTGHLGNKEIMAENLKRYMNMYGLDRNDIAEIAGVSYFTVRDWLVARTYPRIDKIEILANHWNISKADLVEPESERPKPLTPLVEEITKVSSQLEEPRQQIVLDTANLQLDEQQKLIEEAKKREKKILSFRNAKTPLSELSNVFPYDPNKEGYAPVIGEIAAGTPILSEENFEGMRPVYGKYAGRDDVFWIRVRGESMESEIHDGSFALILQDPNIDEGAIGAIRFLDDNCATLKCVYFEYDENGYLLRMRLEPLTPNYQVQYADEYNPAQVEGRLVKVEQDY